MENYARRRNQNKEKRGNKESKKDKGKDKGKEKKTIRQNHTTLSSSHSKLTPNSLSLSDLLCKYGIKHFLSNAFVQNLLRVYRSY